MLNTIHAYIRRATQGTGNRCVEILGDEALIMDYARVYKAGRMAEVVEILKYEKFQSGSKEDITAAELLDFFNECSLYAKTDPEKEEEKYSAEII